MLRYMYWKDPKHPLLRHYEASMLLKPLQDPQLFDKISQPWNTVYKDAVRKLDYNCSRTDHILLDLLGSVDPA